MISIVDDNVFVREAIRDLMSSLGYKAAAFASAEEYLEYGQLNDTTCLITDLQMPGRNGLELQSQLRAKGYRTPIIFVSALPEASARVRALDAGAVAFLSKPFEEASLIDSVELALRNFKTVQ